MRMGPETAIDEMVVGAHDRCHIMMGILTLGMVPIEWVVGYGRLMKPINGIVSQHIIKGIEVGKARQMTVEYILSIPKKERPKWLFFYGDDMIPSWDGFVRLYEEAEKGKWDCLTGLYFIKQEPATPLMWRKDIVGRMEVGRDFKSGDVVHVDMTGLDFTLIRVSMLERMAEELPGEFFKTGPTAQKDIPTGIKGYCSDNEGVNLHTEDYWFYNKVKELEGTIGVHTGVRVGHFEVRTGAIY